MKVLKNQARLLVEAGVVAIVFVERVHHAPPVVRDHQLWREGDMATPAFGLEGWRRIDGLTQLVSLRGKGKQQNEQQGFLHVSVLR